MNQAQIRKLAQKLGIKEQRIDAKEVIIKTSDKDLVITNPSVLKMNVMNQEMLQITGDIEERKKDVEQEIKEEDINMVVEQAGVSKEQAIKSLKENKGDIAASILSLKSP